MATEPDRLEVTDGTDTVVLTNSRNGWLVELQVAGDDDVRRQRLLEAATQTLMLDEGGRLELWIENATPASDRVPLAAGFVHYRDLWRLERPLPAPDTDLVTRPFTDADIDGFLEVNNRAFDWHPEQGNFTPEELAEKCAEPWFDPDGFRLLELEGRLAGFCWTKVHADESPPVGEIYAIAVDPDFHGRGLGRELTLDGLSWLSAQGLRHSMLYVESDNRHANRLYEDLGFRRTTISRAFQRIVR
jgi:mycothiol synthase